jgi:hypothetical protein
MNGGWPVIDTVNLPVESVTLDCVLLPVLSVTVMLTPTIGAPAAATPVASMLAFGELMSSWPQAASESMAPRQASLDARILILLWLGRVGDLSDVVFFLLWKAA